MKKRDFLTIHDLTKDEIMHVIELAKTTKTDISQHAQALSDTSVALVFQKPSNRTRVSFEIGIWQLGGKCIYLSPREIDLGKRESTEDVAKTLSRYVNCIVARTFSHDDISELSKHASATIVNGLSDLFHPCQALADLFTIYEECGSLNAGTLAYVGDGNNVCHSLLLGSAKVGLNMAIATPKGYEPNSDIVNDAKKYAQESGATITLTHDPKEAVNGASIIYTDVWTSMGQESEKEERLKKFQGFQINKQLLSGAANTYCFMHCLPAHREEEVAADIIDGPNSIVFDQAENRMHIQKALLLFLLKNI